MRLFGAREQRPYKLALVSSPIQIGWRRLDVPDRHLCKQAQQRRKQGKPCEGGGEGSESFHARRIAILRYQCINNH